MTPLALRVITAECLFLASNMRANTLTTNLAWSITGAMSRLSARLLD
jgi:hypothetical protein